MKKTYLTVMEYADLEGISIEEVYNRIFNDKLKGKTKQKGGQYFIEEETLQKPATEPGAEETAGDNAETTAEKKPAQDNTEALIEEIKALKAELALKDKQIADYALRFADLAQQAQVIAGQAQYLQAREKPKEIEAPEQHQEQQEEKKPGFFARWFK